MFHRGFIHGGAVEIDILRDDHDRQRLRYDSKCFELPDVLQSVNLPETLGFAGFRVHHPLNRSDYYDEVIVFLGASYFRAVAKGQVYGASARGLAVDTGMDKPEEFPAFREFWIVRPEPGDTSLTIYALLASTSVTGAYKFRVYPGLVTRVEVMARLFLRRSDAKWGLAPLTSMFLRGEETPRPTSDFRPEVHDSDGLLIADGDEWLWRPLAPRAHRQISRFEVGKPRGFGLLQRDRALKSYADLEAHYDLRPSLWVEPGLHWPQGALELVELPTNTEYADNVVAYWRPEMTGKPRRALRLDYQLSFLTGDPSQHLEAKATTTRHVPAEDGRTRFLIDWESTRHFDAGSEASCEPVITADHADVLNVSATRNSRTGGWRIMFDCAPHGSDRVTLLGYLKCDGRVVSEKWSYLWQPN
jgi:glucans biosynthesis protein